LTDKTQHLLYKDQPNEAFLVKYSFFIVRIILNIDNSVFKCRVLNVKYGVTCSDYSDTSIKGTLKFIKTC